MPNYRHVWVPGGTYFLTVNLLERKRTLLTDHMDSLRAAFRQTLMACPFIMSGHVILPDPLHCIWTRISVQKMLADELVGVEEVCESQASKNESLVKLCCLHRRGMDD